MSLFIEDITDDIMNENDINSTDISVFWKRKYAYVKFYFSEGTCSRLIKFNKKKLKQRLLVSEGTAHSVMRNNEFYDACV